MMRLKNKWRESRKKKQQHFEHDEPTISKKHETFTLNTLQTGGDVFWDFFCVFLAPNFVSSMQYEDFVFFYFRETSEEYTNCGKVRIIQKNERERKKIFYVFFL